jgi:poly-gamma-glutamate capsule biosynthesis protein CapA/YwtB (metallophosphatase superfamily)
VGEDQRTILVAGDLAPLGRPESWLAQGEIERVFGDVLDVIKTSDCFLVNLECPLTRCNEKFSKAGPHLRANPDVAPALQRTGISVVSLANNHIFDYGSQGLADTIAALERNSIRWFGVGENAAKAATPLLVDLDGSRLALLSYAEREFNWQGDGQPCTSMLEPAANVLQIQHVKQEVGTVLVFLHCGPEGTHFPPPRVVKLARAFAEAGASAVVVSHSHAVMGCEVYRGVPIAYGLGNFLFDGGGGKTVAWRVGLMVRLTVRAGCAADLEIIPVRADPETGCIDLLGEGDLQSFREFHRRISETLASMSDIEEYWRSFCASQVPHLGKEILKSLMAMLPGGMLQWLLRRRTRPAPHSYYRKGANILRALLVCENHQDMLGQVFDLVRENRLAEYRTKARELREMSEGHLRRESRSRENRSPEWLGDA